VGQVATPSRARGYAIIRLSRLGAFDALREPLAKVGNELVAPLDGLDGGRPSHGELDRWDRSQD
jgi:hypothetical protein